MFSKSKTLFSNKTLDCFIVFLTEKPLNRVMPDDKPIPEELYSLPIN